MAIMPVSEKIFVRLTKDPVTARDGSVEKRARETPGSLPSRSDAICTCLHCGLQEELPGLMKSVDGAGVQRPKADRRPKEAI
jgi:hypothetical protein